MRTNPTRRPFVEAGKPYHAPMTPAARRQAVSSILHAVDRYNEVLPDLSGTYPADFDPKDLARAKFSSLDTSVALQVQTHLLRLVLAFDESMSESEAAVAETRCWTPRGVIFEGNLYLAARVDDAEYKTPDGHTHLMELHVVPMENILDLNAPEFTEEGGYTL